MQKFTTYMALLIIVVSFAVGLYFYPSMPEIMASHWNAQGQVDGYMPKFWALFLMPMVSLAVLILFMILPKIDPFKANIEKFRKYFNIFIILLLVFLLYIYSLTIAWNKGVEFNMGGLMTPSMAILFFYCGVLMEKSKRNWFIGIRTPWTLSNDNVWDKTHKVGGKLFKLAGIIALLGILWPSYSIMLVLIPVIAFAAFVYIYSYYLYRKETSI